MYTGKILFSLSNKIISITVIGVRDLSVVSLNTGWRYNHLFPIGNKMADKPQISLRIGVNHVCKSMIFLPWLYWETCTAGFCVPGHGS